MEEQSRTTAQDNTQDATIASPVFMRSAVKATALNNGWYTIIYNGKTGYISAQYASKTKPATISTSTVVYTTSALKNNWYTTTYNGRTGYVSAQYVTSQKHCTAVYWLSVCLGWQWAGCI